MSRFTVLLVVVLLVITFLSACADETNRQAPRQENTPDVCKITSPNFVGVYTNVKGEVIEEGGYLKLKSGGWRTCKILLYGFNLMAGQEVIIRGLVQQTDQGGYFLEN